MKKTFFTSVLLVLFFAASCSDKKVADETKTKQLTEKQISALHFDIAELQQLEGEITLNGKVIPDENNLVNVFPMIGGKVISVNFEIGDLVDTLKAP